MIGNRIAVRVNVTLARRGDSVLTRPRPFARIYAGRSRFRNRTDRRGGRRHGPARARQLRRRRAKPVRLEGHVVHAGACRLSVRADMPARSISIARTPACSERGATVARREPAPPVQSSGDVGASAGSSKRSDNAVPWLSMEVGGEGGLTRLGDGSGSDAGYGGSGSLVGGLGPVALALGYRYTRIRYGGESSRAACAVARLELRYHFRPGASPVRPYIGAVASVGRWYDSRFVHGRSCEPADVRRNGGCTVRARDERAPAPRGDGGRHECQLVGGSSSNGLFATANIGLTFDIFSPAR